MAFLNCLEVIIILLVVDGLKEKKLEAECECCVITVFTVGTLLIIIIDE